MSMVLTVSDAALDVRVVLVREPAGMSQPSVRARRESVLRAAPTCSAMTAKVAPSSRRRRACASCSAVSGGRSIARSCGAGGRASRFGREDPRKKSGGKRNCRAIAEQYLESVTLSTRILKDAKKKFGYINIRQGVVGDRLKVHDCNTCRGGGDKSRPPDPLG